MVSRTPLDTVVQGRAGWTPWALSWEREQLGVRVVPGLLTALWGDWHLRHKEGMGSESEVPPGQTWAGRLGPDGSTRPREIRAVVLGANTGPSAVEGATWVLPIPDAPQVGSKMRDSAAAGPQVGQQLARTTCARLPSQTLICSHQHFPPPQPTSTSEVAQQVFLEPGNVVNWAPSTWDECG